MDYHYSKDNNRGRNGHNYSEEEVVLIKEFYTKGFKSGELAKFAKMLGRRKENICRFAKKHGWTNQKRATLDNEDRYKMFVCVQCDEGFERLRYEPRVTCSKKCFDKHVSEIRKEFFTKWHKENDHPRGMKGKTHTQGYIEALSKRMKEMWGDKDCIFNSPHMKEQKAKKQSKLMVERIKKQPNSVYSRTKKGWMKLSFSGKRYYFRSGWEMKYAAYLDWMYSQGRIKDWEYEPDTFWFEKIKRGVRSYTPDFKIYTNGGEIVYHEVKGWMDKKSKTKLKRMRIYHKDVNLVLIQQKEMKEIEQYKDQIPDWE